MEGRGWGWGCGGAGHGRVLGVAVRRERWRGKEHVVWWFYCTGRASGRVGVEEGLMERLYHRGPRAVVSFRSVVGKGHFSLFEGGLSSFHKWVDSE